MKLWKFGIPLFLAWLFLPKQMQSQARLEKGFAALEIYNYFEAKSRFEKALKKNTCGASMGLSKIYLNDKNPFHNLDSARIYALVSKASWETTLDKDRERLQEFAIDSLSIVNQLDTVARVAFIRASEMAGLDAMEQFIEKYPWSKDTSEAYALRNAAAFSHARSENSSKAYLYFIKNYPKANQVDEAQERYDQRLFEEATSINRAEDYAEFILTHPDSPYRSQAEDRIYEMVTTNGTVFDYLLFIRKHPNNPHVNDAWREVYMQRTRWMKLEFLMEFVIDFPMYPFREEVLKEIDRLQKIFYPARSNQKWGLIDGNGRWVLSAKYDYCEPFSEGMALIEKNGLFGYVDLHGNEIVKPMYEEAMPFSYGQAIVFNGRKYGTIDRFGNLMVPFEYDEIGDFSEGMAVASKNGKLGYINTKGEVVVPFEYEKAYSFQKNRALVAKNEKFGIINPVNRIIIPFAYEWIEFEPGDTLFKVKQNDLFGLLTEKRDTILDVEFSHIGNLKAPILVVKDKNVGYVNRKGEWIIPLKYESDPFIATWGEFEDGYARMRYRSKMGVIDTMDTRIVPAIFRDVGPFQFPLYSIRKNELWGFADKQVKLIIPYAFERVKPFYKGRAWVKKDGYWGMIDTHGSWILDPQFVHVNPDLDWVQVENDSSVGLLDAFGVVVIKADRDDIRWNSRGYFVVEHNRKLAYFDPKKRFYFWREEGYEDSVP